MTPGARLQAAVEILESLDAPPSSGGVPADRFLAGYFRSRRYMGSGDRGAVRSHVYGVLRGRAALDWWLARHDMPATSRNRVIASQLLKGETLPAMDADALASLFNGQGYGPAPLDEVERTLAEALTGSALHHDDQPPLVAANCPSWMEPFLVRAFGDALADEMAALNQTAPLDLRINPKRVSRDQARDILAGQGVVCTDTPYSPWGLRAEDHVTLSALPAYAKGLVEVQDEGSQLAALLTGAEPGMKVADYCAGAGGKTLALTAAMKGRGMLMACDVARKRMADLPPRLKRAGIGNVTIHVLDEAEGPQQRGENWAKRHEESFDRVLVDAPCSGSGAWRRNPDARWRLSADSLSHHADCQKEILARAAPLVKPGGRLVYATCSVLCEENEDVVTNFLETHGEFATFPVGDVWADTIAAMERGVDFSSIREKGEWLRLSPARHGCDGFFVAIMERRK
ncbi:MAG: RsmB/NOP family class I SAM-dependent RNA methyltransferase [Alphaproteobacteria bacterium]|nr:RsmB/NOP family class I SAM-dependent RNA methyltransferase [Alphaproteobacteria bacterium]